ncbi:MAG: endonuclease/exonuclease/phosphatase family protein [Ignavibacteriales bacterium]|nr:endonuclease/exonuclease/phosphatase family protein [Ignavibacteriales bacterium]
MKKYFLLFAIIILCQLAFAQTENITVMSYNIRCGFCEDSSSVNNWSNRKYLIAYLIKSHKPDLIGLQEAEMFQVNELIEMLDEYDWYGVSREDGKVKGESTAILYKKKRVKPLTKKTLWLSETPNLVSKGWDAALKRTVTIIKFKDKKLNHDFYYANTHFDHIGEKARTESSSLLVDLLSKYSEKYPVIFSGDLNYTSTSEGYKILTSKLLDTKIISEKESGGNITFNGFGSDIQPDNKIDFIFVNDKVKVLSHIADTTLFNGLYPSDHYPVIAELKIN